MSRALYAFFRQPFEVAVKYCEWLFGTGLMFRQPEQDLTEVVAVIEVVEVDFNDVKIVQKRNPHSYYLYRQIITYFARSGVY